ncbi:MAG: NAD-dependent epimerase/dehydratase family protein [Thermoplasmata archaeon]
MSEEYKGIFEDKTILVTGGAGAIGNNLVERLSDYEAENVIVLDDLSSGYEWLLPERENVEFIKGSILNDEKLRRAFKHKPDYVFHLAAHFANQNSVDHPETDLMVNGMGLLKTLEHAQMVDPERFIYASSGCGIYGLDSEMPFKEPDTSLSHHTPYQVTKLVGELYTNYFNNLYDLPIVNARFFNVFGPGEVPGKYRNVIPNFFYWSYQGRELPITGTGDETRDWTYVGDIINGLLAMTEKDEAVGEAINLGSGVETKVIDMANMINERTGNENGVKYVGRRDWDVKKRLCSSIEKAENLLDYEPKYSFEEGLDKIHEWFEEEWETIDEYAEF